MRWMVLVMVSACSASEVTPVEPAAEDLAAAAAAINPCPWDGRRASYCFAEMGFAFSGAECIPVCIAPENNAQRRIFARMDECVTACSCKREKFASPVAVGDDCDQAWAVFAPGAFVPWEGCARGAERCLLAVSGPLDESGLATLCSASAQPEVVRVECTSASN